MIGYTYWLESQKKRANWCDSASVRFLAGRRWCCQIKLGKWPPRWEATNSCVLPADHRTNLNRMPQHCQTVCYMWGLYVSIMGALYVTDDKWQNDNNPSITRHGVHSSAWRVKPTSHSGDTPPLWPIAELHSALTVLLFANMREGGGLEDVVLMVEGLLAALLRV